MAARPRRDLTTEGIRGRLRAAGLRVTTQRVAVLEQLQGAPAPMTHAEIAVVLEPRGWDRATTYRNLMDLTEAGLLRRADVGDHVWRFELRRESEVDDHAGPGHPHFVCGACGTVACLPPGAIRVVGGRGLPKALEDGAVEIQLKGRCDSCG